MLLHFHFIFQCKSVEDKLGKKLYAWVHAAITQLETILHRKLLLFHLLPFFQVSRISIRTTVWKRLHSIAKKKTKRSLPPPYWTTHHQKIELQHHQVEDVLVASGKATPECSRICYEKYWKLILLLNSWRYSAGIRIMGLPVFVLQVSLVTGKKFEPSSHYPCPHFFLVL